MKKLTLSLSLLIAGALCSGVALYAQSGLVVSSLATNDVRLYNPPPGPPTKLSLSRQALAASLNRPA